VTCIVGLVEGERVLMGGDSAATGWNHSLTVIADHKVIEKGSFLLGVSGSPRAMQLLRHSFTIPDHDPRTDTETYIATRFVDALRECFKNAGYAEKNREAECFRGSILVGYQGQLFTIHGDDYQIERSSLPYMAIGCAFDVALGSLYSTTGMPAEQRVVLALEAAEQFSAGVRRPFVVKELCANTARPETLDGNT
jgi:hypothetical protein